MKLYFFVVPTYICLSNIVCWWGLLHADSGDTQTHHIILDFIIHSFMLHFMRVCHNDIYLFSIYAWCDFSCANMWDCCIYCANRRRHRMCITLFQVKCGNLLFVAFICEMRHRHAFSMEIKETGNANCISSVYFILL